MNKKALLLLTVSAVTALVACTSNQSSTSSTSESSASISSVTSSITSESTSSSSTSSKVEEKKEFTIDGVTYKQLEDDDFLTVTKIAPEDRTEINVLPEVEGKTVKALWPNLTFAPNSTVKKIVLPDTITTIGDAPFRSYKAVEELVVPFIGTSKDDKESVIGFFFGQNDKDLQSMALGTTLKKVTMLSGDINPYAFYYLRALTEVTTGASIIGDYAFNGCASLTALNLTGDVTSIGTYALNGCSSLVDFDLPTTLTELGEYALDGITATTLTIPAGLTSFIFRNTVNGLKEFKVAEGSTTFSTKDGVLYNKDQSVLVCYPAYKEGDHFAVPTTVKEIGDRGFLNVKNLKTINLGQIEKIGIEGFRYSKLTEITLPSTCLKIEKTAFSGMPSLTSFHFAETIDGNELVLSEFFMSSSDAITSIVVPEYVKEIPNYAFSNCESLESLTIKGVLRRVGQTAFSSLNINSLELTLANNAVIGERPFANCKNFQNLILHFEEGTTQYPTLEGKGFGEAIPQITVDNEEIATALKAAWPEYSAYIAPASSDAKDFIIEDGVLLKYTGTNPIVNIPDSVTKIGDNALAKLTFIEQVTIPSSVKAFGYRVFDSDTNLMSINFEHETLDGFVFNDGKNITNALGYQTNPLLLFDHQAAKDEFLSMSGVMGKQKNTTHLTSDVAFEDKAIYSSDGKKLLRALATENYVIKDSVETIGQYALYDDKVIKTIDLNNVTYIDDYAFSGTTLTEVNFGDKVTYVGNQAFQSCESLTSITFTGATTIGESAFSDCNSINHIDLGDKLVSIAYGAFTYATDESMEYVVLPASLTNLDPEAFADSMIPKAYCKFSESYAEETFEYGLDFVDYFEEVVFDYVG